MAMIEALVINLDDARERLAFQKKQLDKLNISWKRLRAVESNEVDLDLDYWSSWSRPLRKTEMACLRSHQAAWRKCLEVGRSILILEDDAVLHPDVGDLLKKIECASDGSLEHISLETRGRKKIIRKQSHIQLPLHELIQDRSGAAAYILHPNGARKVLELSATNCGLADAVIADHLTLRSWQAYPALAIQLDQIHGETAGTISAGESQIDQEGRPSKKSMRQRIKRCRKEFRSAMMCVRLDCVRKEIPFKGEQFPDIDS